MPEGSRTLPSRDPWCTGYFSSTLNVLRCFHHPSQSIFRDPRGHSSQAAFAAAPYMQPVRLQKQRAKSRLFSFAGTCHRYNPVPPRAWDEGSTSSPLLASMTELFPRSWDSIPCETIAALHLALLEGSSIAHSPFAFRPPLVLTSI
ncbi:hypothetical protein F5Y00DRAFT_238816, partial [Daldinia vernicosa]|uniref:uncharacterized protein n=1 Tax=Daldinia vernicosa TaxID=114800 RepID=UPI0020076E02